MATPPSLYEVISIQPARSRSGITGMMDSDGLLLKNHSGMISNQAGSLTRDLHELITEDQIFRIDHYLGKETVQNLLVTRFANGIFEPLWNRNYIHRIEITSAESIGVEERGGYYDSSGALRDMVQNHLLADGRTDSNGATFIS